MHDDAAFRKFVEGAPPLLRFGHLLTGSREAVEDLVQTSLMKTQRAWPGVVRKDDPMACVKRATVTRQYRSWRRWNARLVDAGVPDLPIDDGTGDRAERAAMLAARRRLPPRQRAVNRPRRWDRQDDTHRRWWGPPSVLVADGRTRLRPRSVRTLFEGSP